MTPRTPRSRAGSARARIALPSIVLAAAVAAAHAPLGAQGRMRDLSCRGNAGMVLRVDQDPSPRDTAYVVMVLEYTRSTKALGRDLRNLDPGTCTWNLLGYPDTPVEPGRVRFLVRREAQPWSATRRRMMDTTVRAAVFFPDPITLPRYLQNPSRYWKFYVNDETNLSTSFGAMYESGAPTYVWITGPVQLANDVRRDLLCRGGTSGLLYGGGASAGNNQARVQLSYRVSPNVPGPSGSGLAPGSCAWTSRTAMPPEPGKIWFVTAANAQLRQMQSGTPVDRTPTAAERYADMRTIPEYLKDPAHFWRFTVASRAPDSAMIHGVWKPDLALLVTGARTAATSTVRAQPATSGTTKPYTPGAGGATSRVNTLFDIRNVTVTPGLEGVVIRFEAAANSNPTVTITPATVGAPIKLAVGSSAGTGGMMRYVAASNTKLPRGMNYNYGILASATGNARQNSTSGTFRTLSQRVTIVVSQISLISDGDADSDGEVIFDFTTCPSVGGFYLSGVNGAPMSWGDGLHRPNVEIKSDVEAPDQFRLLVGGTEDDRELLSPSSRQPAPDLTCRRPNRAPGGNADGDWNSLVMDFDLTKYPGTKAGDSFYRRSQPLGGGSRLMFEIRGAFQVTRQ
jgi:hypothetical protein